MDTFQQNVIGLKFQFTIKDQDGDVVDVSSATTQQINFEPPSGEDKTKTSVFSTDGTNGKIEYVTVANDLDELGHWKVQAKVVITAGTFWTNIREFQVLPNLF